MPFVFDLSGGAVAGAGALAGAADKTRTDAALGQQNRQFALNQQGQYFQQTQALREFDAQRQSQAQDFAFRQQQFDAQQQQVAQENALRERQLQMQADQYANQWLSDLQKRDQDTAFRQQQLTLDRQKAEEQAILAREQMRLRGTLNDNSLDARRDIAQMNNQTREGIASQNNQTRLDVAGLNNQTRQAIGTMADATRRSALAQRATQAEQSYNLQRQRLEQQARRDGVTAQLREQAMMLDNEHRYAMQQIQREAEAGRNARFEQGQQAQDARFNAGQANDAAQDEYRRQSAELNTLSRIDPKKLTMDEQTRLGDLQSYFRQNPRPPMQSLPTTRPASSTTYGYQPGGYGIPDVSGYGYAPSATGYVGGNMGSSLDFDSFTRQQTSAAFSPPTAAGGAIAVPPETAARVSQMSGQANSVNLPPPESYPAGTVIRQKSTGRYFRTDGARWSEVTQ